MSKNPKTPAPQYKQGIALYIPTPCHENWDAMTPAEQGRFCQSCAKEVVDFSMMTDQQVLNYFSKSAHNICGRFNNDQLNRPLQPTKIEKKKAWWVAAMMPLLMLVDKVGAQRKKEHRNIKQTKIACDKAPQLLGMVLPGPETPASIQGVVVREADLKPIPFAIITAGGDVVAIADSLGRFNIAVQRADKSIIEASADGYKTGASMFESTRTADYTITLQEDEMKLADIIIPGDIDTILPPQPKSDIEDTLNITYTGATLESINMTTALDSSICIQTLGFVVATDPLINVSLKDTLVNIFSKPVTIYPNPAPRGSNVTITVKEEGDYSVQVFDNSGKLVIVNNYGIVKAMPQAPLNIPAYLPAATYYVRLINKKNKKQYTNKLIVM